MKKIIINFCLIVLCFTFSTCHKYPEGGWSNVAIKHLFGGTESGSHKTWKLKLYEVNGLDSTGYIITGNGITNFSNDEVTLSINNARAKDYRYRTKIFNADMNFNESQTKTELGFTVCEYNCLNNICERNVFNPEFNNYGFYWKIIRLKKNELILSGSLTRSYKLIFTHQ